jgi:hypothetical protein
VPTPNPYVAARYGGSRYHIPGCQGLHLTRANGNEVPVTRGQALARGLTPCALCIEPWSRITPLAAV